MNADRASAVVDFCSTLLIFGAYAAGAIAAVLVLHVISQFLRPLSEGWRERGPSWEPHDRPARLSHSRRSARLHRS